MRVDFRVPVPWRNCPAWSAIRARSSFASPSAQESGLSRLWRRAAAPGPPYGAACARPSRRGGSGLSGIKSPASPLSGLRPGEARTVVAAVRQSALHAPFRLRGGPALPRRCYFLVYVKAKCFFRISRGQDGRSLACPENQERSCTTPCLKPPLGLPRRDTRRT